MKSLPVKNITKTPSGTYAGSERIHVDAKNPTPLGKGFCDSAIFKIDAIPFIVCLLVNLSPFTVIRRISKIIIDSFNAFIWRALPHVSIKVFKGVDPVITDSYASTSVINISGVLWVFASPFHASPSVISLGFRHPMRDIFCLVYLTTTGFGVAVDEFRRNNNSMISTRTNTVPFNSRVSCADIYGGKFSELLSGNIKKLCHNILRRCIPNEECVSRFGIPAFGATLDTGVS